MTLPSSTNPVFIDKTPYNLKAISQEWVKERSKELGEETPYKALEEATEVLLERLGSNVGEDAEVSIYTPHGDEDPYIIKITLDQRSSYTKRMQRGELAPPPKNILASNLQEEFDDLIYRLPEGVHPKELTLSVNGKYVNPKIGAMWRGFQLYHYQLTIAAIPTAPNAYNRSLGRYIVSGVSDLGVSVFVKTPFAHKTKAEAVEEANRLSARHGKPFAVYRCLDIIENSEYQEEVSVTTI